MYTIFLWRTEGMKKLLAVLLVLVVAATVFAGGGKDSGGGGVTRGMNRQIIMGVSQVGAESEWRNAETTYLIFAGNQ
jgi:hypothetical protein